MLDQGNTELLIGLAENPATPPLSRVDACSLLNKTAGLPAKEIKSILQEVIDDFKAKSGAKIKALGLLNSLTNETAGDPELDRVDEELVRASLMKEFVKCPT